MGSEHVARTTRQKPQWGEDTREECALWPVVQSREINTCISWKLHNVLHGKNWVTLLILFSPACWSTFFKVTIMVFYGQIQLFHTPPHKWDSDNKYECHHAFLFLSHIHLDCNLTEIDWKDKWSWTRTEEMLCDINEHMQCPCRKLHVRHLYVSQIENEQYCKYGVYNWQGKRLNWE